MAITPNSINLLETSLRALQYRGKVIANNMVNFDTPGYRRKDVKFDKVFAEALKTGDVVDIAKSKPEIFEPRLGEPDARGNDVDLEREVGEKMKNSGMYKTNLRLMAKLYSQMNMAISDRS